MLVTGGQVAPGQATEAAVVISRDGSSVQTVGSMGQARFEHTMVALGSGRVLIIGCTRNDQDVLATTEIYDPATRRFTSGPTMSTGRYKLSGSAAVLPHGQIVVAGAALA